MPLYVYGLMRAEDGTPAAAAAASIVVVEHGEVCALVTRMVEGDVALRRESALAHTDTLQKAFQHGPVLPVRFGTILPDEETLVAQLLVPRAAALRARLEALDGLAEMQVKASYLEEPLLRSIVGQDARLTRAAGRIRELPAEATHFDRISLGEAIHKQVEARRLADSQRFIEDLQSLAVAVSVREPGHEHAVLNASFLVAKDQLKDFDARVEHLSEETANQIQFRLIGPMPAHSFAEGAWDSGVTAGSGRWD